MAAKTLDGRLLGLLACASLLSVTEPTLTAAAPASTNATPLEWSIRMADSEMARLGDKLDAEPTGKQKWGYTTGLYSDALIRLSEETHRPIYTASAEKIIGSFVSPTGKIATFPIKGVDPAYDPGDKADPEHLGSFYTLDSLQAGVATLKLFDLTGEERYRKAAEFLREQLKIQPRTSEGGFWHKERYPYQMWLDGLYMAEPFYADYAKRFNEPADFDDIALQFRLINLHASDPATGLLYHGWDEKKQQPWANPQTGTSACFWSRGIGWYAMALVDVLDDMPANHPARPALIKELNDVAQGILKYQDPKTGVWWQITDQGARTGNYLEATGSSMFVYALAKGVNHGYLPRSEVPAIRAGYAGLIRQFVTIEPGSSTIDLNKCCKDVGLSKDRPGTFAYYTGVKIDTNDLKGIGPFINAGMECAKLFGGDEFSP